MDIKGTEEKLNHLDSFLTTLTRVLKKHWFILLLILIGFFIYLVVTSEDFGVEPVDNINQVDSVDYYGDDSIYVDEYGNEIPLEQVTQ